MNYLINEKQIPENLDLKLDTTEDIPRILQPKESSCPSCQADIISFSEVIPSKATVYGCGKIYKGSFCLKVILPHWCTCFIHLSGISSTIL